MPLIVIDGLDGSGKSTQLKRLETIFKKAKFISFPDYERPSSALVRMYLGGELSDSPDGVNAYAASSFYAVDRYASYKQVWEKNYLDGQLIIAARYVSSNALHQMGKLPENEWDNFLKWLENYEYDLLGLPRPDKVIFLDMPPEASEKLLNGRYGGDENKKDIHEKNKGYMLNCRKSAFYAADKLGWSIIACAGENNEPLPEKYITDMLAALIREVSPDA